MSSNFDFLKKVDKELYLTIEEAEKLYKDEYFEQCVIQTRKFGEKLCRKIMQQNNQKAESFDEMIEILKDNSNGYEQEKEFINDLYFIKKHGNQAVHKGNISNPATTALDCLKCSFETAINYCVYIKEESKNILKLNYDVELLITNKKRKVSLKEKYEKMSSQMKKHKKTTRPNTNNKDNKNTFKFTAFWYMVLGLLCVSIILVIILFILVMFSKN